MDEIIRAEDLTQGDVVVFVSGATWKVEAFTTYRDQRDGRRYVSGTGHDGRGEQFALLRRASQTVRVRRLVNEPAH